ncbi:hypothetical protein [Halopseudomonas sabulinigri]|uniref:YfiR family protein n=1 Tax=Halopseudomonas sabulinigri TaxID=472181 RepID=A0ABP9ZL14_9GAMM
MSVQIRRSTLLTLALGLLCLSLLVCATTANGTDSFSERRVLVGLKLFRTLVAADLDIDTKISGDNQLNLLLVYADDETTASNYQKALEQDVDSLNGTPVSVRVSALSALLQPTSSKPAAIFVSQALRDSERDALVRYSIANNIIVFSPFEEDVERGVLAGLSVQATVRPLINMQTLSAGQFNIKPFYLKVAKHYE